MQDQEKVNEWAVGSVLVCDTSFSFSKCSIVRETATTWVLDDGTKIKKGTRNPIGERGYGARYFYSSNETEGMMIITKMKKWQMVDTLKKFAWEMLGYDKLKQVVDFLKELTK